MAAGHSADQAEQWPLNAQAGIRRHLPRSTCSPWPAYGPYGEITCNDPNKSNNMAGAAHELCSSGTRGCTITVVRAYVGVTDNDRYRFLAAHQAVTGVNVWQPSGGLGSTPGLGRSSNCPYTESTDTTAVLEWHLDKVSKPYKNPDAPASTHGPISELRCPTVTRHLWRSRLRSGSQRTDLRSSLPIVSRSAQGMPWWCHDG